MSVESTTRTPSPRWPVTNSRRSPAGWTRPAHPVRQPPERPREWVAYAVLAGSTALMGCLAAIAIILAR